MHIIDKDVPLLLLLPDMERVQIFHSNLTNQLVHNEVGDTTYVDRFYIYPFIRWDALQHSLFTYSEPNVCTIVLVITIPKNYSAS